MNLADLEPEELDVIMEHAFERYFKTAGLFGSPTSCMATIEKLKQFGVDEIACLIDFGVAADDVLASLPYLDELRRMSNPSVTPISNEPVLDIPSQIRTPRRDPPSGHPVPGKHAGCGRGLARRAGLATQAASWRRTTAAHAARAIADKLPGRNPQHVRPHGDMHMVNHQSGGWRR